MAVRVPDSHLSTTATFFRPSGQKLHALTLVLNLCTMAASLHGPLSSVPNVAVVERELQLYLAAFLNFRLNFWRYSPSSVWCMKFKLLIHQIAQKVRVPLKVWLMINPACDCEHYFTSKQQGQKSLRYSVFDHEQSDLNLAVTRNAYGLTV